MEENIQTNVLIVVGLSSWLVISALLKAYWLNIKGRGMLMFLGCVFLMVGIAMSLLYDMLPVWFGAYWKPTPTLLALKYFITFGVAALSANMIASAFIMPTEEERRLERIALAYEIATLLKQSNKP